ncbi:hypothetical protein N7G274_008812 [Stereocaulon virgatum]|uniref:Origin recognition complex subunit 2 n=1 Tax=Stereocaulon virgatum TaxID=373712 RepID=A0ABR3ZYL2_9LECA
MAAKRKRNSDEEESHVDQGRSNPRKTRRAQVNDADDHSGDTSEQSPEAATPIKTIPRRERSPRSAQKSKFLANGMGKESNGVVTPSKLKGNRPFSTPSKPFTEDNGETENSTVRNADRSARRKSARTLIDTRAVDGLSEEDDLEEEDLLAKKIWDADEVQSDDDQDEAEDELAAESATPATPSKRKRGQRKKSPTPPQNLPPHEQYFWENRPGKIKTSNNTLSSVSLLTTCDHPNFALLWDVTLRDQYNFLFHDTTTFISYAGVEIPSVIDSVNELLGRSGRSIKGKEGVGFVLRSLPENARNLYRVLIAELLAAMDEDGGGAGVEGQAVIEYKVLYQKVVEEFICSNEMGFRQLLKEFHDHEMVVDRKEGLGVPFRREEMESILEGLME